jgi:hypothetical protein
MKTAAAAAGGTGKTGGSAAAQATEAKDTETATNVAGTPAKTPKVPKIEGPLAFIDNQGNLVLKKLELMEQSRNKLSEDVNKILQGGGGKDSLGKPSRAGMEHWGQKYHDLRLKLLKDGMEEAETSANEKIQKAIDNGESPAAGEPDFNTQLSNIQLVKNKNIQDRQAETQNWTKMKDDLEQKEDSEFGKDSAECKAEQKSTMDQANGVLGAAGDAGEGAAKGAFAGILLRQY